MTAHLCVSLDGITTPCGALLVQPVSFRVESPALVWIWGPNGAGKSVLTSILSGKAFFAASEFVVKGTVELRVGNASLNPALARHEFAQHVSYMPQRVATSLLALHHQDDICLGIEGRFPDLPGKSMRLKDAAAGRRVQEIVTQLDVWAHLTKRPGECSYGETRLIEFACAVSPYPDVFIADEPFSGLDQSAAKRLVRVLAELRGQHEAIWVLTSHRPAEEYGVAPDLEIKLEPEPDRIEAFRNVVSAITSDFGSIDRPDQFEVSVKDLLVKRRRDRRAIRLSLLETLSGRVWWIEGPNGSGKTTILSALAGLLANSKVRGISIGGVVEGGPYKGEIPKAPSDGYRIALQDPQRSFLFESVAEDLRRRRSPFDDDPDTGRMDWQRPVSKAWGKLQRPPREFSFGQLKFLQLLLVPPCARVVLVDEPLLGLHPDLQPLMRQALSTIAQGGRVVLCTQQPPLNSNPSDNVFRLPGVSQ